MKGAIMNGFQITADAYKTYLEKNPDDENRSAMERKIELLSFLATCSDNDIYELYNSSAFNDITKGYVRSAMKNLSFDEEQISDVLREIKYLHDTKSAGEVV